MAHVYQADGEKQKICWCRGLIVQRDDEVVDLMNSRSMPFVTEKTLGRRVECRTLPQPRVCLAKCPQIALKSAIWLGSCRTDLSHVTL